MSEACTCEYDASAPAGTVCRWCSANRREVACDTCGEPVKPGLEEWARRHGACTPGLSLSAVDAWRALKAEQRLELMVIACRGCGSLDVRCQCWNDE